MSGCSLMGTKVLLWRRVLFTATLHQGDKPRPQTILNGKLEAERRLCIPFPNGNTCRKRLASHILHVYQDDAFTVSEGVMGNVSRGLRADCGKVSIICLGTHQCLAKKLGLMTVQQRGGERLHLSQSTSRNMIINPQLSSVFTGVLCEQLRGNFYRI